MTFFRGARGGNPRISGVSARSTPMRVPSWGDVSRKGTFGYWGWRGFSGHFRTSGYGISGRSRAAGGHGGGQDHAPISIGEQKSTSTDPRRVPSR